MTENLPPSALPEGEKTGSELVRPPLTIEWDDSLFPEVPVLTTSAENTTIAQLRQTLAATPSNLELHTKASVVPPATERQTSVLTGRTAVENPEERRDVAEDFELQTEEQKISAWQRMKNWWNSRKKDDGRYELKSGKKKEGDPEEKKDKNYIIPEPTPTSETYKRVDPQLVEYNRLKEESDWESSLQQGLVLEKYKNNKFWWRDYINRQVEELEGREITYGENQKWFENLTVRVYVDSDGSRNLIRTKVADVMPDFETIKLHADGSEVSITWKELFSQNLEGRRKLHNRWIEWETLAKSLDPTAYTKLLSEGSNLEPENLTYGIGYLCGDNLEMGKLGDTITSAFGIWNLLANSENGIMINGQRIPNIFASKGESYKVDIANVKKTIGQYLINQGATEHEAAEAVKLSWRLATVWGVRDWGDAKQPDSYEIPRKKGLRKFAGQTFTTREVVAGGGSQSGPLASVMHPREYMGTVLRKAKNAPGKYTQASSKQYWVHPEKMPKAFLLPFARMYSCIRWQDSSGEVRTERRSLDKLMRPREFGGEGLTIRQIPWGKLEGADQSVIDRHYELMTVWSVQLWNSFFTDDLKQKVSPKNIRSMLDWFNKTVSPELMVHLRSSTIEEADRLIETEYDVLQKRKGDYVTDQVRSYALSLLPDTLTQEVDAAGLGNETEKLIQTLSDLGLISVLEEMKLLYKWPRSGSGSGHIT